MKKRIAAAATALLLLFSGVWGVAYADGTPDGNPPADGDDGGEFVAVYDVAINEGDCCDGSGDGDFSGEYPGGVLSDGESQDLSFAGHVNNIATNLDEWIPGRVIPLGADDEELEARFSAAIDGYNSQPRFHASFLGPPTWIPVFYDIIIDWDLTRIDTSEAGVYYPFILSLPPGAELSGGLDFPDVPVFVKDPDAVHMRFFENVGNRITINWIKPVHNPTLWISVDGGDWEQAPDTEEYSFYYWGDGSVYYVNENVRLLHIDAGRLASGYTYELEIRYDGGVSLETLLVRVEDGIASIRPPGGDRTGENREEQERPPIPGDVREQDRQGEKTDASHEPARSIRLTGEQLDGMIAANPDYVTLIEDDSRVSLPSGTLESLNLEAHDSFTVTLAEAGDGGVSFAVNGEEWEWPANEAYLISSMKEDRAAPVSEPAAFVPAQSASVPNELPLMPIIGLAGLTGAGGLIILRPKTLLFAGKTALFKLKWR